MPEEYEDHRFACPCCGRKTDCLTLCDAHDWEDSETDQKYRDLVDKLKPGSGSHAYVGHGCMVCPDCEEAFYWKSDYCPLAILNGGLEGFLYLKDKDKIPQAIQKMLNYWREQSPDSETLQYRAKLFERAVERLKKYTQKE